MAEVFEAELAGHGGFVRKVAIKRMLESAATDPTAAQRFLDEATIASRLHHANVISVVDLGLLDDRPFQVLEYVDGIDAQRLMQRTGGKLPLEVALAIAGDVAHALDHAHTAVDDAGLPLEIVHRDVKPSNVLLSWGGDVKLGDFGIAVARDRAATTEAGVVAGTLGFIAPEQRQRGQLDGRTDVFALGLTLHALLTGASPLSDIEVEMQVLAGQPVPIDLTLPADIRAILARTLAVARTDRPTAAELATQLDSLLAPRLARGSRSLLRDFLATYENRRTSKPGALDALLGIEVVMTGGSSDPVPRYETRALETATMKPEPVEPDALTVPLQPDALTVPLKFDASTVPMAAAIGSTDTPTQALVPRDAPTQPTLLTPRVDLTAPRRRRVAPIAIALVGLCGIAGIAAWQLRGSGAPVIDAAVVASADAVNATPVAADAGGLDAVTVADAGALTVTVVAVDAKKASAPDATERSRDAQPTRDAAAGDAATPDAATGTGYLQVIGEELIAASVIVDGKNVGSVPNLFPVSFGSHRVEVERRDGTRLPARVVDVTATNNRANPVRLTW